MRRGISALLVMGALAGLITVPARADDLQQHEHSTTPHVDHGLQPHVDHSIQPHSMNQPHAQVQTWWHGDIHHFHERDIRVWRAGHWWHGVHGGRVGWWWLVGGIWYFYPAPIYPYPDPYVPPVVTVAPPTTYYWCSNPAGYYPQVPACPGPWQAVPASAPPPQ